jgi:hypothetical protein
MVNRSIACMLLAAVGLLGSACRSTAYFATNELCSSTTVLRLSVDRLNKKWIGTSHLRFWVTLENLSDEMLQLYYNGFVLHIDGQTYGGVLRRAFSRDEGGVLLPPRAVKRTGPIEFLNVPSAEQATLELQGIGPPGGPIGESLSVVVPLN